MAWFRRKKDEPDASSSSSSPRQAYAPGTQIAYDPSLIERFEGHHATLLKLFGEVQQATGARSYAKLQEKLSTFRRVLDQHLLEENLRLYVYLSRCLAGDPDNVELADSMRREMTGIGRDVRNFVTHYGEYGVNDDNVTKFSDELEQVGATLQDRITREESSLYTLYLPPENYASPG